MASAPLTVRHDSMDRYTVQSGDHTYTVDAAEQPPACTCEAYRYRPKARPCKHGWAVIRYQAEPQARLLNALSDADALDVIDPPTRDPTRDGDGPDPEALRIANGALQAWRQELAAGKRTREQFDPLWMAACATIEAHEALGAGLPHIAARWVALARALVEREAAA